MIDAGYNRDDKVLLWLAASLVLPYPITLITIIVVAIYFCYYKKVGMLIKKSQENKFLFIIDILCLVVSLLMGNPPGIAISIILFLITLDIIYFREYTDKSLFIKMLDIIIFISVLGVASATMEQINLCNTIKGMDHFFDIQNKPNHRVQGFYFNPNYFAMMLVFIINICVYRMLDNVNRRRKVYYLLVAFANIYALYLTGGRVALVAMVVSVTIMMLACKKYHYFAFMIISTLAIIGVIIVFPNIIPRLSSQGVDVERRELIWKTAKMMIDDNLLFGYGPLGYFAFWPDFLPRFKQVYGMKLLHQYKHLGISSQHAHTMFLEPLISFGLIGTVLFLIYFIKLIIKWFRNCFINYRHELALVIGFIVTTGIFCVVDFPIMWIQTGTIFLFVLNSVDFWKGEKN